MPEQTLLAKARPPHPGPAGPAGRPGAPRKEAAGPSSAGRNRRVLLRTARTAGPWAVPLLVLVVWQWTAAVGILPPSILPAPGAVLRAGSDLAATGELQFHILTSLRRILQGFALGAGTGLLLGFLVGMSKVTEILLDRSLQMVRTIPHLALVPLMIAWFGIGEEPKILLVALGTFFPIYLNTVTGIRGVDPKLLQLGRSYGLGRWRLVRDIAVPGAMPTILSGIRYSLGVAWMTLVVAETISASDGIGYLAQNARELLRTDQIVLAIVLYALAGLFADLLTRLIERRVLRWHPNYRPQANQ
ncbi:ABC transporter permease subunit [Streptomyces sp. NPDC001812]|jgi:sulfonate transport system permease protein|uniref:ABC transporter permease subunit n=1 Tax=Streptomyces cathayae TaxID=3031124 RepID=A0ABY8KA51_9ACTN|nr:ABC transporter permease subunit [Streptomyces sp. HUAS 5]WGD44538.1 ABC transporter permease subunit [Streptomyces sp. HUAS 5]